MDENKIREKTERGRRFVTSFHEEEEDYLTDQQLKKPQPPLAKAPMRDQAVSLPCDFESLELDHDFLHIINSRKSHRVYTETPLTMRELSYLLWCTQGVKEIRGRSYATLRTVPCGGGRHEFECYLAVRNVSGLEKGLYHYLPMSHEIEFLGACENMEEEIAASLQGQTWSAGAAVVFYYSAVFYRAEWRYGIHAHVPLLIDSGHITENLYLALTAAGMGGCAIAAVDPQRANRMFTLDGKEESIFYAMTAGHIDEKDAQAELDFYAFVKEQGL